MIHVTSSLRLTCTGFQGLLRLIGEVRGGGLTARFAAFSAVLSRAAEAIRDRKSIS